MAPALAPRHGQVIPSTSDEAPGLLAYGEPYLKAHHAPDIFHVQQELRKAVSAPMAIKERAAHKAATEAHEQLAQGQTLLHTTGGGLRSLRRPLVGTYKNVGVLERLFPPELRCFCLAQRHLGWPTP